MEKQSLVDLYDERSISHLLVAPPRWARVQSDTATTFDLVDPIPSIFRLGPEPRCKCGGAPHPTAPIRIINCVLFTSRRAFKAKIEVQRCAACPLTSRLYAGPDLRELGIFNFNNARLYSHELLNGFTNAMTAHDAPFNSYRTFVSRHYVDNSLPVRFVSNPTWRTVWFSFSHVQDLTDSFSCTACGPNPEAVIFDGVTAGFDVRHCTSSLHPPTIVDSSAVKRLNVTVPAAPLTLIDGQLRKSAQAAVRWRKSLTASNKSPLGAEAPDVDDEPAIDEDTDIAGVDYRASRRRKARDTKDATMRSTLLPLAKRVTAVHPALGTLFGVHVLSSNDRDTEFAHKIYLDLLEQVCACTYTLS